MKKIIVSSVLIALVLLMSSCGGSSVKGTWKIDPASLDIVLGAGFPEEMKQGVEQAKAEAKSEDTKSEADKITLELLDGGIAKIKHVDHPDETQEIKWEQKGKVLNFNGEIEGEKFNANLDILESSANEMKIGFTGESLLEQIKKERPELIEQVPAMFDLNKLVEGASISIKLKKA